MDLHLYARVVRRFWPLVVLGTVLAVLLAFVSFFRVGFHGGIHVAVRQTKTWKGSETILLTQKGFPWGRTVYPYDINRKTGQPLPSKSLADPSRFTDLAVVYAEVANGDAIRSQVFPHGSHGASYSASPVVNSVGSPVLGAQPITQIVPLVQVEALAGSPARARAIAARASNALRSYVEQSQERAGIPPSQRVLLQVLSTPRKATLARGYRLTGPIVIFLGTLVATLLLAFVLENLRPRVRKPLEDEPTDEPAYAGGQPASPAAPYTNGGSSRLPSLPGRPVPQSPGRALREARLLRGLDLRVVAVRTGVPTKHLRALESERFDLLPDEDTARHALRAYAEHLELDPAGWLADGVALSHAARSGVNGGGRNGKVKALTLSVPLVVALLAGGLALFLRFGFSQRPVAAFAAHSSTPPHAARVPARRAVAPVAEPRPATAPATTQLVVSAVRGDSWVVIRAGSSTGRTLFAGTLKKADTVRRSGRRLWIQLGAAANVDVTVDGAAPGARLYGTVDAVVSQGGFRKVPLAQ
ncbi:MAG TPA: helix-turn-helix domain-containing protein [Gaiellaceae bacterium]|nr:helix-turn-helix domain-containing protein [Gaiellaceae bacterium]